MGFSIARKPSAQAAFDQEHRIVDLGSAATTQATLATADTAAEILAADATATFGRFLIIRNDHATATSGILLGGTTYAEAAFYLEPGDVVQWDADGTALQAISQTAGATLMVSSAKYMVA